MTSVNQTSVRPRINKRMWINNYSKGSGRTTVLPDYIEKICTSLKFFEGLERDSENKSTCYVNKHADAKIGYLMGPTLRQRTTGN